MTPTTPLVVFSVCLIAAIISVCVWWFYFKQPVDEQDTSTIAPKPEPEPLKNPVSPQKTNDTLFVTMMVLGGVLLLLSLYFVFIKIRQGRLKLKNKQVDPDIDQPTPSSDKPDKTHNPDNGFVLDPYSSDNPGIKKLMELHRLNTNNAAEIPDINTPEHFVSLENHLKTEVKQLATTARVMSSHFVSLIQRGSELTRLREKTKSGELQKALDLEIKYLDKLKCLELSTQEKDEALDYIQKLKPKRQKYKGNDLKEFMSFLESIKPTGKRIVFPEGGVIAAKIASQEHAGIITAAGGKGNPFEHISEYPVDLQAGLKRLVHLNFLYTEHTKRRNMFMEQDNSKIIEEVVRGYKEAVQNTHTIIEGEKMKNTQQSIWVRR